MPVTTPNHADARVQPLPTYLIPDDLQEQLIAWGDRRKRDNRWLGQTTLYLFARLQEEDRHYPKMDVYKAISQLAGTASRTIRYHARLAETYPDPIWEEFDVLPYSHFDLAARYPTLTRSILETAVGQMDHNGGKPPTVEWLRWRFGEEIAKTVRRLDDEPEPDTVRDADPFPDPVGDDAGPYSSGAARLVLNSLLATARKARRLLPRLPLPSDSVDQIRIALDNLVRAILETAA